MGGTSHCLSYRYSIEKGCPAKNAVGAKNPSMAGILDRAEKWVEAKSLDEANNWIIDRKSS